MDLFEQLMMEKDKIMMDRLTGQDIDFSKLREVARAFSESYDANLAVDGSDQELWKSVTGYFRDLLK